MRLPVSGDTSLNLSIALEPEITWQAVARFKPGQALRSPDVNLRHRRLVIVERGKRHVDLVGKPIIGQRQGRSAIAAEGAHDS